MRTNVTDIIEKFDHSDERINSPRTLEYYFGRGKYTIIIGLLLQCMIFNQCGNMFYMAFSGLSPTLKSCGLANLSTMDQKEICGKSEIIKKEYNCTFDIDGDFYSMNMEFQKFCEDKIEIKKCISSEMVGVVIGSLVGGKLSDYFGRRKIMLIAIIFSSMSSFFVSFARNLDDVFYGRGFLGLFNGCTMVIVIVYVIENIQKSDRVWMFNVITWAPNIAIFTGVAYLSHDWRDLARKLGILTIPAILFCFYVPESPKWLIQQGRLNDAKKVIKKIAKINGIRYDMPDILEAINMEFNISKLQSRNGSKKYSFYHLFYTKDFVSYIMTLSFIAFTSSTCNYGILFNMDKMSGTIYQNMLITAALRYPLNILIAICDIKISNIGRKAVMLTFILLITACSTSIAIILSLGKGSIMGTFIRVMQLLIITFTSQLYTVGSICSSELFPTPIRNMAYAVNQLSSRLGNTIAPYFFYLSYFDEMIPYCVISSLTLIAAGAFLFFIPETKGHPLNEIMPMKKDSIFRKKSIKEDGVTMIDNN
uniref:MFS domain-containing protein n=1 Tax=Parastrongyloides trichosuri TaxID=131310 RepID=A0A0N4ZF95_PARTI